MFGNFSKARKNNNAGFDIFITKGLIFIKEYAYIRVSSKDQQESRHTFATVLLEQRENSKIVSELMGHTKVKTTLDLYSHIVDSTVFEGTARTLDKVYNSLTQKDAPNTPDSADLHAI